MAKKKNQSKKHKFKYADPAVPGVAAAPISNNQTAPGTSGQSRPVRPAVASGPTRDLSYVAGDLRRILILAIVLVGLEFLLWFLFTHTGVGNQVYNLVRV